MALNQEEVSERIKQIYFDGIIKKKTNDTIYEPQPTDVVVIGHPKSGTTWLQQILHQIRTKGDEDFEDIYKITLWIPYRTTAYVDNLNDEQVAKPRIFKSHETYERVPQCENQKFIVIFREPLDCYYSLSKFLLRHHGGSGDCDDAMMEQVIKMGSAKGTDYCGYLANWLPHRNDSNVLWIHYEDLKADLKYSIKKIAEFIDKPLNEQELQHVHDLCTFEYMSKNKQKFSGDTLLENMAKALKTEAWKTGCGIVREDGGSVGQGNNKMSDSIKKLLQQRWESIVTPSFGYKDYQSLYKDTSMLKNKL